MEAPLYPRSSSQKTNYLQPENQTNLLDDRLLQLLLWTMNSCDRNDLQLQNCAPLTSMSPLTASHLTHPYFAAAAAAKEAKMAEAMEPPPPPLPQSYPRAESRKAPLRCSMGVGPPPRPFKKARYASEIKNYDFTMRRMCQTMADSRRVDPGSERIEENGVGAVNIDARSMGPPTGIECQSMGMMPPQDADARLLRWHTRQLCRSIFDNTVNRMLENMGFSPGAPRPPHALHPLLVLSLAQEEEEARVPPTQLVPPTSPVSLAPPVSPVPLVPQGIDAAESAPTSDYDSSDDDDSDLPDDEVAAVPGATSPMAFTHPVLAAVAAAAAAQEAPALPPSLPSPPPSVPNEVLSNTSSGEERDANDNCIGAKVALLRKPYTDVPRNVNADGVVNAEPPTGGDSFFVNAIHLALKQQGLGYQTA